MKKDITIFASLAMCLVLIGGSVWLFSNATICPLYGQECKELNKTKAPHLSSLGQSKSAAVASLPAVEKPTINSEKASDVRIDREEKKSDLVGQKTIERFTELNEILLHTETQKAELEAIMLSTEFWNKVTETLSSSDLAEFKTHSRVQRFDALNALSKGLSWERDKGIITLKEKVVKIAIKKPSFQGMNDLQKRELVGDKFEILAYVLSFYPREKEQLLAEEKDEWAKSLIVAVSEKFKKPQIQKSN